MTSGPRRPGEPAPNRIHRLLRRTLAGLLLALPAAALAQGNGRISGVVTDPTGALMPGVKVVVTQVGTRETAATVTGADGGFVFPSLRPATYDLSASSEGFSPYTQKGIVLRADQSISVDVGLQVGGATESVSVEAAATQVNVTSSTLSQVVEEERIVNLPLNGRNAAALTTLVSGVVVAPTAQADQGYTKTFPVVVMVSANGSRAGQTNYMLDGGNNVDEYTNVNAPFPFPDALQEFSVQTSNYNAEYGQNAGGVVNIVTKGGTEAFHGTVFEYNRNKSLNAAPYFSPDKVKDPLKRNQFGGTLGGPLKGVPRAFFFVGYQRTMIRNQPINDSAAYVPTQAQRNGVFNVANAAQCIRNPFTGAAYPCTATATAAGVSTVDPSHFNRSALALLQYLPVGDAAGTVFFRKPTRENLDEAVVRLDKEIGSRDRLTVRYFYDRFHHDGVLDTSNLLTYADQATVEYQNVLLTETHVFSDRFLNTVSFGYQQNNASRGPLEGGINVADLGVSIWQPAFKQINQIQVSPGFTIGDNPAATFDRSNFTFKDDVNLVRGSHSFGFGVHAQLSTVQIVNQFRQPGAFTFNANESNNAMASFLLGYVANFQQASGQFFDNRGRFVGVYAQDTWQVSRRLTLNLGLRYEPFLPWQETEDRMGAFSPEAYAAGRRSTAYPNAPIGLLFPGDQGMLQDGIRAVYSGVMPRVGFAWDATGDGKTSLRGGIGIFYDTRLSSVFNNIYSNSSPFITQVSVNKPAGGFGDPYAGMTNPFPAQQPPPATTAFPTQSYLTFSP